MPRSIHSEIVIDAPPEAVWAVLTDFPSHAEWDPFLASVEGAPVEGSRLKVTFRNGFTLRPTVTEAARGRVLEWFGKLGVRGVFDGRHRFELIAEGSGTRLTQSETFTGFLVPFIKGVVADAEKGFRAFNEALKRRVEQAA